MEPTPRELLTTVLKYVSRSFYTTLRILPGPIRSQIGLAYLLARTTDTVADTSPLAPARRVEALEQLRRRILGETRDPLAFEDLARHQANPAEAKLLAHVESSLRLLDSLSPPDLALVRSVLRTIISGQALDLRRFENASAGRLVALQSDAELDDYTWRVAGCVGGFWTRLCREHLFPEAPIDEDELLVDGIRFGKGLQLVNILRDLPADLRQGRCYLPEPTLRASGLQPADLLNPETMDRFRPVYEHWLLMATDHLRAGWRYTNRLPHGQFRLRLGCAWPILIGVQTLKKLRTGNVLDATRRLKVTRAEVRGIVAKTLVTCPFPNVWRRWGVEME